jgi:hypothetical protein
MKRVVAPVVLAALLLTFSSARVVAGVRTQSFDRDPGWEGHDNRIVPKDHPTVTQDFGYSPTHFAGSAGGEMGGEVQRASEPAFYADKIEPKTLNDRLSASGSFALTRGSGSAGVFFGFFNAKQPGAGGRPIASLGMNMDCEGRGGRLAVRLITAKNQSCGTFVTPYLPGKFRPTPIRADGTRYTWTLDYDPDAAGGRGQFTFTLHGASPKPGALETAGMPEVSRAEARRRFPDTTTFTVKLPEGFKQQGTTFDHFGLMNMMKPGGRMTVYFDDLQYLGRSQDFSRDPNWDASGNRATYKATDVGGAHDFGFSGDTHHAGGAKPGEVGGTFWRANRWGYYADKIEPLSLDERLEAHGKVALEVAGPDADMAFGWFHTGAGAAEDPEKTGPFLGIHVGGPTRLGHPFSPRLTVRPNAGAKLDKGRSMLPAKTYDWSVLF